jgi:DNA-binding NtrC family response regulator
MPDAKILIVDDDANLLRSLRELLEGQAYTVTTAGSAEEALERCHRETFHLVLCDLQLPGKNGISLIKTLHDACPSTAAVLITGHGSIRSAVTALKRGAVEYVTKPVKPKRLLQLVAQLTADLPPFLPNHLLTDERAQTVSFDGMHARSRAMHEVFERIRVAAGSDAPVLVLGENGSGKELVARSIHARSRRAEAPFAILHSGALPPDQLGAELLGRERGWHGATEHVPGKLEQAEGGTLFIDELTALDEQTQGQLARVIETGRLVRMGGRRERACDVRLIAASSLDAESMARERKLREDLYYPLATLTVHVAPLRDRTEDVPVLADQLLREFAAKYGKPVASIAPEAQRLLCAYGWPGNVRELRNVIEQSVLLARGPVLEAQLLPQMLHRTPPRAGTIKIPIGVPIDNIEKEVILRTLEAHHGNKTAAAQALGISRRSIYNKLASYGL